MYFRESQKDDVVVFGKSKCSMSVIADAVLGCTIELIYCKQFQVVRQNHVYLLQDSPFSPVFKVSGPFRQTQSVSYFLHGRSSRHAHLFRSKIQFFGRVSRGRSLAIGGQSAREGSMGRVFFVCVWIIIKKHDLPCR